MKYLFFCTATTLILFSCASEKQIRVPYSQSEKEKEIINEISTYSKEAIIGISAFEAEKVKKDALEKKWNSRERIFNNFREAKFEKKNNKVFTTALTNNILFEIDSYELTQSAKELLKHIFNLEEEKSFFITGYTDNVGREEYNLKLSTNRAIAVGNYFRELGAKNVKEEGKGESNPKASNDTAQGRKENRRVEITIKFDE